MMTHMNIVVSEYWIWSFVHSYLRTVLSAVYLTWLNFKRDLVLHDVQHCLLDKRTVLFIRFVYEENKLVLHELNRYCAKKCSGKLRILSESFLVLYFGSLKRSMESFSCGILQSKNRFAIELWYHRLQWLMWKVC